MFTQKPYGLNQTNSAHEQNVLLYSCRKNLSRGNAEKNRDYFNGVSTPKYSLKLNV